MKLKKGDTVVVISGKDKGKEGEIVRVLPKDGKVIVEGVNIAKKHQKARPGRPCRPASSTRTCRSTRQQRVLVHKGKPTRVGYRIQADGKKVRVAKRTGEVISMSDTATETATRPRRA